MTFDSQKEYKRYCELLLLERAGEITELRRQVKCVLIPSQYEPDIIDKKGARKRGRLIEREIAYIADFIYIKDGKMVVEDTKGYKTPDYIMKRKMMLYFHNIRIQET